MGKGRGKCYALDKQISLLLYRRQITYQVPYILHMYAVHLLNQAFQNSFTGLGPEKTSCQCMFWYGLFFFQVSLKQGFKDKIETSLQNRSRPHGMLLFQKCQSNSLHPRKECLAGNMCNDGSMLLSYQHIKNCAAFHREMTKKPTKKQHI